MASPEAESRLINNILIPALDKIIKNSSWRKHSKLAHESKSLLEHLTNPKPNSIQSDSDTSSQSPPGVLHDSGTNELTLAESELILTPIINACSSGNVKIAEPALDCIQKLIAFGYLRGEADSNGGPDGKLLVKLIEAVCKCCEFGEEGVELLVLKTILSAVTSVSLRIHGDSLLLIVRTCYDVYLDSKFVVNQTTAKASLVQMLVIVFRRMEADSSTVPVQPIVVAELMEPSEKGGSGDGDGTMTVFVQGFISKVIHGMDGVLNPGNPVGINGGVHDGAFETKTSTVESTNPADLLDSTDKDMLDAKYWEISMYKTALEGRKGELADGEGDKDDDVDVQIGNKLRRDAFLVFRALCKLSMKTLPKDALADPQLMRGKIVALELLKILLENAGDVFRTSERFLGAIKQYLCLSLLKNSASTLIVVFQLSCSIFISLLSRFRSGLKAEIGVFFPMIVLRVLENVAQPNVQQKMIILRFLERLCLDSQILVDLFVNYDCDVNSSNIFERMVNGLLKTAQGVPTGVATTLLPPQDVTMKLEAMKCLVAVLKSMGNWMNTQLRIPDPNSIKKDELVENNHEIVSPPMENGIANEHEPVEGLEASSEVSDASTIEQRRAYKLELQEGISLFNRKPKKGIEFLINMNKVGNSPEETAEFLKNTSGLNKTMIGDYLGEREDLPLKVMHAYVNSFNFNGMEFDEAIRTFLRGFRLPGEAQKIDRIMEKFAERYCKCNPKAFISADTAYVLAYSVIMLNTDAHNPMIKNKMSADDFIRNNRGIDDGKDLPEEYLRSLFDRISRNEIKMKEDDFALHPRQSVNSNMILGLDSILNIVVRKNPEENQTSDDLMRQMQEQFKEKASKSDSVYYAATDVFILTFMIEVCWAPMLAAFSVPLDQSDDVIIISQCLEGFRSAIHVTSAMSMKTHRDAFVTSLAKFTSLHSPADIKQKNIEAIKAIVTIADEDGNYLQEAWEHILTCVSRFEHLRLLGEGAPPDATFFAVTQNESEKSKQVKSNILPVLKKKGVGRMQQANAATRRGSPGITSEQVNSLISKLNLLEQVGEMNRIFIWSQKLNSEAIVDFVRALCNLSMKELRSTSDPRVFCLTKIVEIAHYNMNRIRLVWTSIWNVLSDFFVTIGCSENLSIAIFAMDSLRQLSMKFLEREELANYNFQNEFLKPFVIVMRKSSAVEIRELILRCISQMVLSRVSNVKSGWKSMFMVFTTAAYDDHKNIVLLAFEMMEKIVRDYFPYITETETTTFTDCVNCLIAFTSTRFDKDISLNAISFLRLCAAKLAKGDLGSSITKENDVSENISPSQHSKRKEKMHDNGDLEDIESHLYFWFPLLAGLSDLSFDPRHDIRQNALDALFDTLRNNGHQFSLPLWEKVFDSVLFPIFDYVRHAIDPSGENSSEHGFDTDTEDLDQDSWLYETCTLALQLVVDLFVNFYDTVNPLLKKVLTLLVSFIKRPHQSLAGIGIAAFVRLISNSGELFNDDKWLEVVLSIKEAANATLPDFLFLLNRDSLDLNYEDVTRRRNDVDTAESSMQDENLENLRRDRLYASVSDVKCRAAVQLLLIQAIIEIYNMYRYQLSTTNTLVVFDAVRRVASHAHKINADIALRSKIQELGPMTQIQDPPLLRLEIESYQTSLTFVQNLAVDRPPSYEESNAESQLIDLCQELLKFYVEIARPARLTEPSPNQVHWLIPLGSGKKKELAARAPLVVTTLQAMCSIGDSSFEKNLSYFFPLFTSLISCEHGSSDVQVAVSQILDSSVGPVLLRSC
ncbi:brefeldin A-inhibited guanine nucleotide-exchange protein 2-like [Rutidosis leptorrhynchoides]|uniref:brefeldin A-inhibited guanine nucleotide-exchange protein 2-like n=1 Tax=Rutidosis leptorrhynchoides TaxID=125765 RepID=UPI003A99B942